MTAFVKDDVEIREGALHRGRHFFVVVFHHGAHESGEVALVSVPCVVALIDALAVCGPTRGCVALFVLRAVALQFAGCVGFFPRPHVVRKDRVVGDKDDASSHVNLPLAASNGGVKDAFNGVIHPHDKARFALAQHRICDVVRIVVGASDERWG